MRHPFGGAGSIPSGGARQYDPTGRRRGPEPGEMVAEVNFSSPATPAAAWRMVAESTSILPGVIGTQQSETPPQKHTALTNNNQRAARRMGAEVSPPPQGGKPAPATPSPAARKARRMVAEVGPTGGKSSYQREQPNTVVHAWEGGVAPVGGMATEANC